MTVKLTVLYYSATGTNYQLANGLKKQQKKMAQRFEL